MKRLKNFRLPDDICSIVEAQPNQAEFVEKAIRLYHSTDALHSAPALHEKSEAGVQKTHSFTQVGERLSSVSEAIPQPARPSAWWTVELRPGLVKLYFSEVNR
ncbi:MAG TPA: hypothetical protein VJH23_01170 [archaeon]|nr:hypothetical protein [archaeon]